MRGRRRWIAASLLAVLLTACSGGSSATPSPSASPASASDLVDAGLSLLQQGKDEAALAAFREAAAKDAGSYLAFYNIGVLLQQRGDDVGAVEAYSRALLAKSNYVPALFNRATIEAKTDQRRAAESYKQVIALQPTAPTAYFNLGLIEADLGQLPAARQHLETAIRQDPALLDKIPEPVLKKLGGRLRRASPSPSS